MRPAVCYAFGAAVLVDDVPSTGRVARRTATRPIVSGGNRAGKA